MAAPKKLVGAYVEIPDYIRFAAAAGMEDRSLSSALRQALDLYVRQVIARGVEPEVMDRAVSEAVDELSDRQVLLTYGREEPGCP